MKVRVGDLKHRVTLQKQSTTADGYGWTVGTYSDVKDVWTKITPLSAYERMRAEQLQSHITHKVLLRWQNELGSGSEELAHGYRILYGSRVFVIHGVIKVDEEEWYYNLQCEEKAAEAS